MSKKRGQRGCVRGKAREKADCERAGRTSREDEKGTREENVVGCERGRGRREEDETGGDSLERQ